MNWTPEQVADYRQILADAVKEREEKEKIEREARDARLKLEWMSQRGNQ